MPPLLTPKFFIGHESLKDVWVNKFRREEDIGHEHSEGRVQYTESQDGVSLDLRVIRWDTRVKKTLIPSGRGGYCS
jgi:hypothetical protein